MRILQVGKFPKEHCGGVENAVFSLSEALARDHDVEVVTSSLDAGAGESRSGRLLCRRLPTWFKFFSTPFTPALVGTLRRAPAFDVVQVSFQNPMAVLAYLLARPQGRLVVWYHHDIVRQRFLGRLLSPVIDIMLTRASRIVATSSAYALSSPVLSRFPEKTEVIPLGVDLAPFQAPEALAQAREIRARHGRPLVLFIGRLVYYKGLPYLIEAMRDLDADLLIIGQGPWETRLRAQAQSLGSAARIEFLRVARGQSLAPYLHACDLLALPSTERTEAYGLVQLEAMACGKPVVATELGTGTSFVCQHGVTGLVVPPRDPAALRQAIGSLLADPARAQRMGREGRKRVEEHFTIRQMADAFVKLYERLPC